MIYYTSDLHFNHKNILNYCKRPFNTVEEMNHALVANWNARVQKDDTVYILGDFTLAGATTAKKYLSQLNGLKVLIPGNHDTFAYRDDFDMPYLEIIKAGIHTITDPYVNKKIVLCHYPLAVWKGKEHGNIHFYGHVHNSTDKLYPYLYELIGAYNVGVDVHNMYPCTAKEIIAANEK